MENTTPAASPITGHTGLICLLGSPCAHSVSPMMHNASFEALGLDYRYLAFDVNEETLPTAVAGLKVLGARGFNLTMPDKNLMVSLCDELSTAARIIGAVNTVVNEDGRLIGHNTDGLGFIESLRAHGFDPADKTALIIGTGGAGEAVTDALVQAGARLVYICNRSVYRAQALAARYPEHTRWVYFGTYPVRRGSAQADLVVNATSLGMAGCKEFSDLRFLGGVNPEAIVYDLVYNPRRTLFLSEADRHGLQTIGGIELLVHQAMLAFQRWTGAEFDPADMKHELLKTLQNN